MHRYIEAPVLAQMDGIEEFHSLAGFQDCKACRFLFCKDDALDLHGGAEALLVGSGADLDTLDVVGIALGLLLQSPVLLGEDVDELVLQEIALAEVVGLQELQPGGLDIQVHLLLYMAQDIHLIRLVMEALRRCVLLFPDGSAR